MLREPRLSYAAQSSLSWRGEYTSIKISIHTCSYRTTCRGWLRTGDEVLLTENDEIMVVDRIKVVVSALELTFRAYGVDPTHLNQEIIKVKGFQVSPAELEGHLLHHSNVADVGVVGKKDDYAGQLPVAFVVLKGPAKDRAMKDVEAGNKLKADLIKVSVYVPDSSHPFTDLQNIHIAR